MDYKNGYAQTSVRQLKPRETFGGDARGLSPFNMADEGFETSDVVCAGLEEMSRHLRWLDDDYQSELFERLAARARSIVLLADQLGLRRVGQVAADVIYCLDDPDNAALPATLSRLMRLMSLTLEHAAGCISDF